MGVQVNWDDVLTAVIVMTFTGRWTWEEASEAVRQANALLDESPTPLSVIVNMGRASWRPPEFQQNVQRLSAEIHPKTGRIVIVNTDSLYQELLMIIAAALGGLNFNYRIVSSMDEARRLLNEQRE